MAAIVGLLLNPVQTWFFFSECTGSLEGVRCGEGEPQNHLPQSRELGRLPPFK